MATLHSTSGSPPAGRDAPFRVSTREVSLDLSDVGPDISPNELGALSLPAFAVLLEKFATIPAVKLIDGDPQLVVSAKRGRYLVVPSHGTLLVRPAADTQQPYVKYSPADLPGFLDSTDGQPQTAAQVKNFQTLIGSAAAVAAKAEASAAPPPPAAPIYGNFPSASTAPASTPTSTASPASPAAPKKKISRGLISTLAALFVLTAAGAGWIFYGPEPAEAPPLPPPSTDYALIHAPDQLLTLKKSLPGTYATSGEAGERLLEIRADGTYQYQEFGDGLARTMNTAGTYIFATRFDSTTPLLRTSNLGTIEIRDEKHLFCQQSIFKKL